MFVLAEEPQPTKESPQGQQDPQDPGAVPSDESVHTVAPYKPNYSVDDFSPEMQHILKYIIGIIHYTQQLVLVFCHLGLLDNPNDVVDLEKEKLDTIH